MSFKFRIADDVDSTVKDDPKAYGTWAYTKQVMDYWAQLIRRPLDRHTGNRPYRSSTA